MKTISRYIMTLALLLTAVTGAWAEDGVIMKEITVPSEWNDDDTYLTVDEMTGFKDCSSLTDDEAKALLNSVPTGKVLIFYGLGASSNSLKLVQNNGKKVYVGEMPFTHKDLFGEKDNYKYYYTAGLKVAWDASTKTGTFSMPGSDVVLTPIYAKAAAFATTGTGSEAKTLLPEAAEGVIAGTDASLIAEGTGIVAFAGESTEVTQGTLMYAIGTSATEVPELTAFDATVPTAKDVADDGAEVYVWYYIQGADAPEGDAATLDNTFSDTEPACLTVQVLTNKFDIQLNAANANTIEAGKATVTVGGTDKTATVTEGKLQGVKMGSEVKLKAATGYKFRKVEVKKKEAAPTLKDALKDGATVVITYTWQGAITTFTYTNNGGNYTGGATGYDAEYFNNGMSKDGTHLTFTASNPDLPQANVSIDFDTDYNEYFANKGSGFDSFTISVNGTDITSQLTEVK